MKFLISQGRTKRRIEGAFWLCGSRRDLGYLVEQISQELESKERFAYGWLRIRCPLPPPVRPSSSPESWESERQPNKWASFEPFCLACRAWLERSDVGLCRCPLCGKALRVAYRGRRKGEE